MIPIDTSCLCGVTLACNSVHRVSASSGVCEAGLNRGSRQRMFCLWQLGISAIPVLKSDSGSLIGWIDAVLDQYIGS